MWAPEIDNLNKEWSKLGIAQESPDFLRRSTKALTQEGAPQIFCLHDPDGSLWRVLEFGED